MCPKRPDSDDIAETEFCLNPDEHPSSERMAEEGEGEVNKEWIRMKGYVQEGEEEKLEEWFDRGIQEVRTEQEGVNGSHGEVAHHLRTNVFYMYNDPISVANKWQSLTMALRKSRGRPGSIFSQVVPPNATSQEEVKKVKMDFKRFLDLRPKPATDGKCGAHRMSDVCK